MLAFLHILAPPHYDSMGQRRIEILALTSRPHILEHSIVIAFVYCDVPRVAFPFYGEEDSLVLSERERYKLIRIADMIHTDPSSAILNLKLLEDTDILIPLIEMDKRQQSLLRRWPDARAYRYDSRSTMQHIPFFSDIR